MALLGNIDENYTRTGKGPLSRWANGLSYLPGMLRIPILGASITGILGTLDTIVESAQWLFRGEFGSAATVAVAGAASTFVNTLDKTVPFFWIANAASGVTTGETLGTHFRAATESLIGGISGALGSKPQVLSSYPAAIGGIGSAAVAQGPGKFAAGVSSQRGQNADEAYKRYMSGEGGVHVNELQSAHGLGA